MAQRVLRLQRCVGLVACRVVKLVIIMFETCAVMICSVLRIVVLSSAATAARFNNLLSLLNLQFF